MQQLLSAKVFKLSFEYFHTFSPKGGDFCRKNSKIASLLSCQKLALRKTLKYSQIRDLEGIQWILWIYTDAAPDVQTYVDGRAAAIFVYVRTVGLSLSGPIHFDNPDYFHPVFTNADLICRVNPDIVNERVYCVQDYPVRPDWCFRTHP